MTGRSTERGIAEYYDQEARERSGWDRDGVTIARRDAFTALLDAEARPRLLEVGCGTGVDLHGFVKSGLDGVVGVDLSQVSARLARSSGADVVCASLHALPFGDATFDALWTMSTLVHVADHAWDDMSRELVRVLVAGSPVAIGVWGSGTDADANGVKMQDRYLPRRTFHRRSNANMRDRLLTIGDLERFETTSYGAHVYQYAVVRTRAAR